MKEKFCQNIKLLREKRGYSQEVLAHKIRRTVSFVARAESTAKALRPDDLVRLSQALKCSVDDIYEPNSPIRIDD